MNLTESILHNIIIESINKLLLTEDRERKSRNKAREYAFGILKDKQEADELVEKVRNDLGLYNKAAVFTYAGVRMKLNNEYDDSTKDKLASVIRLIADKYFDRYTNDLNGFYAQELINMHFPEVQAMRDSDRNEVPQEYDGESDYQIVRIDSFEQATEYGRYTPWCVTHDKNYYDSYTSNGTNQFYFCIKNGFEQVLQKEGEGCPLDEYGLSMFAVRVNGDGDLIGCTTRWNLNDDRDQHAMNAKQISDVIKMPFYEVFKPNTTWRDTLTKAMQRLANGEDPNEVFDLCYDFRDGFALVKLNGKYNFINQNGQLITDLSTATKSIKGKWFDDSGFFRDGFAKVSMNDRYNFINQNGQLITELPTASQSIKGKWFDKTEVFKEGLVAIKLNKKGNFLNRYGEILYKPNEPDKWFDRCDSFKEGFGKIKLNGQYNFINRNCVLLSPNQWFDACYTFEDGFARVMLNDKYNIINRDGQLLTELPTASESIRGKWFDDCYFLDFDDEFFCRVKVDGKWYFMKQNGEALYRSALVSESLIRNAKKLNYNGNMKQRIRLTESDLHNIIRESANRVLNEISDVNKQWESEKRAFLRGLKDGKAYVDGDTVYVEIGRHNERDPRYVYFRFGGNRLMDDHFYVQSSPKLSKRCIENIYLLLNFIYKVDVSEYID